MKNFINKKLKSQLDELVLKYETSDFIKDDPVQFPHRFSNKKDIEISGLIASSLAYGKREKILESVEKIHSLMQNDPYNFVSSYNYNNDKKLFKGFVHRYTKGNDVALLFKALNTVLKKYQDLESIFLSGFDRKDDSIKFALCNFSNIILSNLENTSGVSYLIPMPEKGSACKRLNLYLKWMIREKPADIGIWKSISKNKLIIPLDVHVARISRLLKLTKRQSNDWKTAEEITNRLKQFDPNDPVKYDFAIFGAGINHEENKLII